MRYPSARGLGVRYLIAALLPFSGICLVIYTAVQLAIAHATNTVPPPKRIADAAIPLDYVPPESEVSAGEAPAPSQPSPAAPTDPR